MSFEREKRYWENQLYWMIKYKDEYVCFILINGTGAEEKFAPLTIWSDDSNSDWYADSLLDEHLKVIVWKNVDFCEHCGSCDGGRQKIIFDKVFDNVCLTTFRFINPDGEVFECIKKLLEVKKDYILNSI
ncbi:hypothetical protein SDC9_159549 [bioreactor metagenome]|uniref:Uncharacterized protein n=1 Tax=bioreactor metagenome TaxID=1076179 RepID=A0A645FD56_9ZZZZ